MAEMERLSDEELASEAAHHEPNRWGERCTWCEEDWPCPAVKMATDLQQTRARVAALEVVAKAAREIDTQFNYAPMTDTLGDHYSYSVTYGQFRQLRDALDALDAAGGEG